MRYRFFGAIILGVAVLAAAVLFMIRQNIREQRVNTKAPSIAWRAKEGWTISDIKNDLVSRGLVSPINFDAGLAASAQSFDFLGQAPKPKSLEGYLFPDTYFIAEHPSAQDVINKMLQNFDQKLTAQVRSDIAKQGRSIYDVLILASIVEKEVGRNAGTLSAADLQTLQQERQTVAGIFINRLNINMALQSDATIAYITKKNSAQATSADLRIDSPYNTYKYRGLPPTPISNPSLESILAAVYYKQTDYLYFLTEKEGTAIYAKTLDQQIANKRKYLK